MHTIREIARLATMLAGLIAPRIRLGFVSTSSRLCFSYALASISCEHCRSSRNHPHCVPRHIIYYYTIWENTQPKHEVSTTNSCECLMLIRPSKDTIHLCDIRMKIEEETYWKYIPSLSAWIYSTKNPEPISINCIKGKWEKGYLKNSGILRLGTGCTARTKYTNLTVTQINKRTEESIYSLNFTFNIIEILPKLDTIQQLPKIKPFTWEIIEIKEFY